MNKSSLSRTTREYLDKLDRLDRELTEFSQILGNKTTIDPQELNQGSSDPWLNLSPSPDENSQVRERVENIQNAFRTIRTEFSMLANLSGLQSDEEASTGMSLSGSLSSEVVLDVAMRTLAQVATVCKD